jgi:hypothetical protein
MATIAFDTLRYARKLESAGFSKQQAEGLAEAQLESVKEIAGDIATKADLGELHTLVKADIAELRSEVKADIAELRSFAKADIAEAKAEILKWMFGSMAVQVGIIVALLKPL